MNGHSCNAIRFDNRSLRVDAFDGSQSRGKSLESKGMDAPTGLSILIRPSIRISLPFCQRVVLG